MQRPPKRPVRGAVNATAARGRPGHHRQLADHISPWPVNPGTCVATSRSISDVADVITLFPYLETGLIVRSVYVPPWARDPQRVLAIMAFSAASQHLRLDRLALQRFAEYEDEVIAGSGIVA